MHNIILRTLRSNLDLDPGGAPIMSLSGVNLQNSRRQRQSRVPSLGDQQRKGLQVQSRKVSDVPSHVKDHPHVAQGLLAQKKGNITFNYGRLDLLKTARGLTSSLQSLLGLQPPETHVL